jgi:uncharacterized membrane protein YfcA
MEILGYLAALLIGFLLGLIGGGGSILTVPVLVYLFGIDPIPATGYSLFIVGITSAIGSISYFKKGMVDLYTALVFGVPSVAAVFFARAYLLPAIPLEMVAPGGFVVSKGMLLMLIFAMLMLAASYSMIKKPSKIEENALVHRKFNYPLVLLEGAVVGLLTGLVGAGGGFLIIPALVVLSKLPMKDAVGTSLIIIAAKSLIGFSGEFVESTIDFVFLTQVSAMSVMGLFGGMSIAARIDGEKLKPLFGWFVLSMGLFILIKEIGYQ